ncbi:hypothetical protein [Stutzerimonas stutzeri]|uniref:hypothetical protein n=1 Tax=Stutzerimonas stutzeri TaxID=316 RepID=UPI001C2E876B|nr:hypothetical protein [Stutzerimonas stutzeri]
MDLRLGFFIASLMLASSASATGTGPTLPEKSREHPLDNREPRQEIIDRQDDRQPRPPTLEAPPEIPPQAPVERRLPSEGPAPHGSEAGSHNRPAS